jgi:COMPASS component SWD2
VTSLDFDDTGELAIVARTDDTLQIYNCKEGKHAKELKSQKYGVHLARFTHHSSSILYASTKVDGELFVFKSLWNNRANK